MKIKILLITIFVGIFLFQSISFALPSITVNPNVIWFNESSVKLRIEVSNCNINDSSIEAVINSSIVNNQTSIQLIKQNNKFVAEKNFDRLFIGTAGTWNVFVTCGNESSSTTFQVKKFKLEIVKPTGKDDDYLIVPIGSTLEDEKSIKINVFEKDSEASSYSSSTLKPSDEIFIIIGNSIKIRANYVDLGNGEYSIEGKIPTDIDSSLLNKRLPLTVQIYRDGFLFSETVGSAIKITPPLIIDSFSSSKDYCVYGEDCVITFYSTIEYYKGEFSPNNFVFYLYSEPKDIGAIDSEDVQCIPKSSNIYECQFEKRLKLNPGIYYIKLAISPINQVNYTFSENRIKFKELISIYGTLTDINNNGEPGINITFEDQNSGEIFTDVTDFNGNYKVNLLPSNNYLMKLLYPGSHGIDEIKVYNVSITEKLPSFQNILRFTTFSTAAGIEGIKPVKIVAFEFAPKFSRLEAKIYYPEARVDDETKLSVFVCENWNFVRKLCNSDWKKIDSEVYPVPNLVTFSLQNFASINNTGLTAAFMIGEQKFLKFQVISIAEKEVYAGDSIKINGKVVDSDGNSISGANITLCIKETKQCSYTISLDGGLFNALISAPVEEGVYTIELIAQKSSYLKDTYTDAIKVNKKPDLSLLIPDTVTAQLDNETHTTLTIINSGQLNLTNIQIKITGLSKDWYSLIPSKINYLAVGESKDIDLAIHFPSKDCGKKCSQFYLVTVSVNGETEDGDKVTKGGSFVLKLLPPKKQQPTSTFTLPNLPTSFFVFTGNLVSTVSSISLLDTLFIALGGISLGLAIYFKRAKSKTVPGYPKSQLNSLLKKVKKEIKKE